MPILQYRIRKLRRIIKRILIIYWNFIGDLLITTPLLNALRKGFPKAHITYLIAGSNPYALNHSGPSEVLKNNPDINSYIKADMSTFVRLLKEDPYDLAIDLCAGRTSKLAAKTSGARIRVLGRLRGRPRYFLCYDRLKGRLGLPLRIPIRDNMPVRRNVYRVGQFLEIADFLGIDTRKIPLPKIHLLKEEKDFSRRYLESIRGKNSDIVIAMHPGGRISYTRLWNTRNYALLADKLIEKYNARIIVFYAPGEKYFADSVCGLSQHKLIKVSKRDIREYIFIISGCDVFIGTDGGPLHMALALGVPTVGIFTNRKVAIHWYNYKQRKGLFSVFVKRNNGRINKTKMNQGDSQEVGLILKKAGQALRFKQQ